MNGRQRILDFLMGGMAAAGLLTLLTGWGHFGGSVAAEEGPAEAGEFQLATGNSATGGALLFVLNTRSRVLNVYEAEGGSRATRGLAFVASRKIERDLYVTGYNDKSEYSYRDLVERIRIEEAREEALEGSDSETGGGR